MPGSTGPWAPAASNSQTPFRIKPKVSGIFERASVARRAIPLTFGVKGIKWQNCWCPGLTTGVPGSINAAAARTAGGKKERDRIGLLNVNNTFENSHYYMGDVVLHALNSQTPYRSTSDVGLWFLELTHRAIPVTEWIRKLVIHKKNEREVAMNPIWWYNDVMC